MALVMQEATVCLKWAMQADKAKGLARAKELVVAGMAEAQHVVVMVVHRLVVTAVAGMAAAHVAAADMVVEQRVAVAVVTAAAALAAAVAEPVPVAADMVAVADIDK